MLVPRSLRPVALLGKVIEIHQETLTPRGRYLLWVTVILAVLGFNTRQHQGFKLFAVVVAMLLVASIVLFLRAPKVRFDCRLPSRATALRSIPIRVRLVAESSRFWNRLFFSLPRPRQWGSSLSFHPRQMILEGREGETTKATLTFRPLRRGRYVLPGASVRTTDPLGLFGSRAQRLPDQVLLVYPRFYSMQSFDVPFGSRYQPGGIPLASHTGETVEFRGTREYRQGDPVKNIHWRSWARVGAPVVKEFQQEYFCRIAIVLDTFLPARPRQEQLEAFEAAISVVASIADYFSQSEYIVDIFAAGPDVYQVSAGRSLAYIENILDVLACLEPCHQPPFEAVGPALFEKLSQITSVVAILQDWDESRQDFLRSVRAFGTELRVVVVKGGKTSAPWHSASDELGPVSVIEPSDVERLLAAEGA